jgi:3',5'-nucleoside bisphosphate phosphatase
LKTYRAELHVHTVLSPCAELEMLPPLIVNESLERGIQIIAITDHNATGNIQAVQQAAEGSGLIVLPGMEVQTREEVHSLCLFDSLDQVYAWQETVDAALPPIANRADYFGDQLIVDKNGDFISREERLLLTSTDISLAEAGRIVRQLGGLFIPAHVNRKVNGLLSLLGIVPDDIDLEALEISRHLKPSEAGIKYPQIRDYPLLQNGDAHRLDEILGVNQFKVLAPTISELRMAIQSQCGRSYRILSQTTSEQV